MDELTLEKEPKYMDLHCLKKGRRILLFLADFFLVFIFALGLFHLGIHPLGRWVTHYEDQITSLHQSQQKRDGVLYGYELLFPFADGRTGYADLQSNLSYTSEQYIHRLVDSTQPEKYEVFATYFVKIRQDQTAYVSFMRALDEGHGFFDINDGSVVLKPLYVEEFAPKFDERGTLSEKGKTDYATFEDKIFSRGYGMVLADITEKDLVHEGVSYVTEQKEVSRILQYQKMLLVICAIGAFLISWAICHIVIPLFSKKRKTIGMMALRVERIHRDTFEIVSLPVVYLSAAYSLAGEMLAVLFVPWGATDFNELFSLPMLFILSLISLVYVLGSLAMILFDGFNRSLGDFLSRSSFIAEDEFDKLVAEGGSHHG